MPFGHSRVRSHLLLALSLLTSTWAPGCAEQEPAAADALGSPLESVSQALAIADEDGDLVPDATDNCPYFSNPNQANTNGVGPGDACEVALFFTSGLLGQYIKFGTYKESIIGLAPLTLSVGTDLMRLSAPAPSGAQVNISLLTQLLGVRSGLELLPGAIDTVSGSETLRISLGSGAQLGGGKASDVYLRLTGTATVQIKLLSGTSVALTQTISNQGTAWIHLAAGGSLFDSVELHTTSGKVSLQGGGEAAMFALGQANLPCPSGYQRVGTSCVDINECTATTRACDALTSCTNTVGSFTCGTCPAGYTGTGLSGCLDVNECSTGTATCSPLVSCTNTVGSFVCGACPIGYRGTGATSCLDINECSEGSATCSPLVACANAPGSYQCGACPSGYIGDGHTCTSKPAQPSGWVNPANDTPAPSDGVRWEPISAADIRTQRDGFAWSQTVRLSETSTKTYTVDGQDIALPPMRYAQIYVRNGDQLRELEELGIHYDVTPLFDSEWPDGSTALAIQTNGDEQDYGATFVFALIPTPVYNAIRDQALAGEDTYAALILRPTPSEAIMADGTVNWDYLLSNVTSYAPLSTDLTDDGDVVPPLEDDSTVAASQKRLGRRLRKWVTAVATAGRALVEGVRRSIAFSANLVTRSTTLHIRTSVDSRTNAPMVRAWDDGHGGFGKGLRLKGLRVNVTGQSRLTLYKAKLDANGEAVVTVPRTLRVNICFEADSPAARFESGILVPVIHCWPKHIPKGDSDDIPSDGGVKAVGDPEFYDLAQVIDARDYATTVLGFTPPKAMVQVGGLGEILTKSTPAFTPCLATPKAPVSLVNAYSDALFVADAAGFVPGAGLVGTVAEFLYTTDIVIGSKSRPSRNTMVHEYGHYFFCTLLAKSKWETYDLVWSQVITPKNLDKDSSTPVKALNEGIADWFASQVTGSVNYFAPVDAVDEGPPVFKAFMGQTNGVPQPAVGSGLEMNFGGVQCDSTRAMPGCSRSVEQNYSDKDSVISTVTSILHDAIDRATCGVSDSVCQGELRNDAAPWSFDTAKFQPKTIPMNASFPLADLGDEQIALSPRDIKDTMVDFATTNTAGTALTYENFYGALAAKMTSRNYAYRDVCQLFRLHDPVGQCDDNIIGYTSPSEVTNVTVSATQGGFFSIYGEGPLTCPTTVCFVPSGINLALVAHANPGFSFVGWTGCTSQPVEPNELLYLTNVVAPKNCVANFQQFVQ